MIFMYAMFTRLFSLVQWALSRKMHSSASSRRNSKMIPYHGDIGEPGRIATKMSTASSQLPKKCVGLCAPSSDTCSTLYVCPLLMKMESKDSTRVKRSLQWTWRPWKSRDSALSSRDRGVKVCPDLAKLLMYMALTKCGMTTESRDCGLKWLQSSFCIYIIDVTVLPDIETRLAYPLAIYKALCHVSVACLTEFVSFDLLETYDERAEQSRSRITCVQTTMPPLRLVG